jgi:predicted flap endonuclease-1-like 5' DNA nuclease
MLTIARADLFLLAQEPQRTVPWWIWIILLIVLIVIILVFSSRPQKEIEKVAGVEPVKSVAPVEAEETLVTSAPEMIIPDDLTKIEGIGPKISGILHASGVKTFAQLSETDVKQLQQFLDAAGIRLADPETWPEQARLAAEEKWDELQALQDSLKGGRRAD